MGLSDIISISITTESSRITQEGFGTPLILSYNATFPERSRTFTDPADLLAVGITTSHPEYLAAVALMAQERSPESFKVGRGALPPTQRFDITVLTVANLTVYSGTVKGTAWSYTSDGSATNDEIAAGVAAAIDAAQTTHTGTTTGSALSLKARITADAAGNWTSVTVDNPALLSVQQNHADPGIATDLSAIELYDDDFYALHTSFNSEAYVNAAAGWAESRTKFYLAVSNDTPIENEAVGLPATDVAFDVNAAAQARTRVFFHSRPYQFADAALLGLMLPADPGTENWMFKELAGVTADRFTTTQKVNLNAKRALYYYTVSGANITFEKPASGVFIDLLRYRDKLQARMSEAIFELLTRDEKVPFTDEGVALVTAAGLGVLKADVQSGALAANPAPTFTAPRVADVSPTDRANRNLPDCEFSCTYAGAVNHVEITGVISV